MKRQPDADEDGGLDSLLDTMTNVVGILVIVLVVTQLGVGDAVQRIADSAPIDPAAVEKAKEELLEVQASQQAVQQQIDEFKPVDPADRAIQIATLKNQLERQKRQLENVNQSQNEFALKLESDKKKAEEAQKKIASMEKNEEEIKSELQENLEKVAKLNAILDQTPEREQLAARVVSIPNPRPAPEGAQQVTFICAHNKVYPLNLEYFRDLGQKRAAYVVRVGRLDRNPAAGIDTEAFLKAMSEMKPLQDDFFTAEIKVPGGRYPRLYFTPRPEGGVEEQELLGPRSRFNRMLDGVDKSKFYARFYVLPDSYDIYITARAVLAEADMLAGWDPQSEDWQHSESLSGPLRLGPPPPPPDPNAPKPPPKPAAPPPNVID